VLFVMNDEDPNAAGRLEDRKLEQLLATDTGAAIRNIRTVTEVAPVVAGAAVEIARNAYAVPAEQATRRREAHHEHQTRRVCAVAALAVFACAAIAYRPDAGQWIVPMCDQLVPFAGSFLPFTRLG